MAPLVRHPADDRRLADYREIRDARLNLQGAFVAEGRLIVSRLIERRAHAVRSVLVTAASRRALKAVLETLPDSVPVFEAPASFFETLTGFNLHRGCLALAERPAPTPWQAVAETPGPLVVLEGITDADNVGSVFRNAAAFGAGGVLLSPTCCDPLYRKAIRTSMGATLDLPFAQAVPWPGVLSELAARGVGVVALTPDLSGDPLDVFLARRTGRDRIALLLGTEGSGLTPEAMATAHHVVRIPTTRAVDSLNVAVVAGIVLSRLFSGST
jgi:tRNA G18 (ribose-2'-O)-methylase SpoU